MRNGSGLKIQISSWTFLNPSTPAPMLISGSRQGKMIPGTLHFQLYANTTETRHRPEPKQGQVIENPMKTIQANQICEGFPP